MRPAMASRRWVRGSLIGAGAFGTVSLAINMEDGELFAVKSVDCSEHGSKAELVAMDNELSMLQSLDSPRIIKCLGTDCTVENGIPMRNLWMEYMAGGSLADLMKKFGGRLDEALIRVYTRGILEGLEYLHARGIVHCDVKGKNILIGSSGEVKLADFGSAKRTTGVTGAARGTRVKGTPLWMAPEVIMQTEQGPASDVWSLGCTIVELATGCPPWTSCSCKGLNLFSLLMQIGTGKDVVLPSSLSAEAKDFLMKCFQRDPKARWTSAQLLTHPFVDQIRRVDLHNVMHVCDQPPSSSSRLKVPLSPTSVSDFPADSASGDWDTNVAPTLMNLQKWQAAELASTRGKLDDVAPNNCRGRVDREEADRRSCRSVTESEAPGRWITVRSPRDGGGAAAQSRQRPLSSFMLASSVLAGVRVEEELNKEIFPIGSQIRRIEEEDERRQAVQVKSAAEVKFECLEFLMWQRRKSSSSASSSSSPSSNNCGVAGGDNAGQTSAGGSIASTTCDDHRPASPADKKSTSSMCPTSGRLISMPHEVGPGIAPSACHVRRTVVKKFLSGVT